MESLVVFLFKNSKPSSDRMQQFANYMLAYTALYEKPHILLGYAIIVDKQAEDCSSILLK